LRERKVPLALYYLPLSSDTWRNAYLMLRDYLESANCENHRLLLNVRDKLEDFNVPKEAWIDFKVLEAWFNEKVPIPLASTLIYLLNRQRSEGFIYVDPYVPHSGATYRTVELALLLGFGNHKKVLKAVNYLLNSLEGGALLAPGPVEGAVPEVGTTSRFLHVLLRLKDNYPEELGEEVKSAIEEMRRFLLSASVEYDSALAWPDAIVDKGEASSPVVGATSLALYALSLLKKDRSAVEKGVRWLIKVQNPDGGWPDVEGKPSNPDNSFNAARALKESLNLVEDESLIKRINDSLKRAEEYFLRSNPFEEKYVSSVAMNLRGRILLTEDEERAYEAAEALIEKRDQWYGQEAHLYNQLLVSAVALAELRNFLLKRKKLSPCKELVSPSNPTLKFLFSFPVEIPPLFPGYKDSLGEKLLNAFVEKTPFSLPVGLFKTVINSTTLREISSLFIATVFSLAFIFDSKLIEAFVLPLTPKGSPLDLFSTTFVVFVYALWLTTKFRMKVGVFNFLMTTFLSLAIGYALIRYWLFYANPLIKEVFEKEHYLALIRLTLIYALLLDVGRRLINVSQIDKIFSKSGRRT